MFGFFMKKEIKSKKNSASLTDILVFFKFNEVKA